MANVTLTAVLDLSTIALVTVIHPRNGSPQLAEDGGRGEQGGGNSSVIVQSYEVDDDAMAAMVTTAERMHWAASVVVAPAFVIVGLVGNVLSLIVWTRPHMKSSTGRYLTALALTDTGVLVWSLLTDTIKVLHPQLAASSAYAFFFAYLGHPVFFFFVLCSVWFMVGVTADRCIMVCFVTKTREYCSEKRANLSIFLITLFSFLINMPRFWFFEVRTPPLEGIHDKDREEDVLFKTEFQHSEAGVSYEMYVHCLFLLVGPWMTVFFMNLVIICKISQTNSRMSGVKTAESADRSRRSETKITQLLLSVTFTFLVLLGLLCTSQCFFAFMPAGLNHVFIDKAYAVAKLGFVINSSINFALYCLSGRHFRHQAMRLIGWKRYGHSTSSQPDGITHGTGTGSTEVLREKRSP